MNKNMDKYEKLYNEALERAKAYHRNELAGSKKEMMEYIFPELHESEDERIRKWLVNYFDSIKTVWNRMGITCEQILAWLEKQKEQSLRDFIDDFPYSDQKEQKPAKDGEDERIRKEIISLVLKVMGQEKDNLSDDKYDAMLAWLEKQKEPEKDIETRWENDTLVVDCSKHKPVKKQDYSGLTDLERAIHRGFLVAGVENVPVTIIKETAQDCLAHMPAWSEEDRLHYANILEALEYVKGCKSDYDKIEAVKSDIAWLKSRRPPFKPSEEQLNALNFAITYFMHETNYKNPTELRELYDELLKLK